MCSEDLYYLKSKGALDLPERSSQEELVFLYFSFVHPCLPLLDEPAFWNDYGKNLDSNFSSFSLVVYQAMMFAASSVSFDLHHLTPTLHSARRAGGDARERVSHRSPTIKNTKTKPHGNV
jgi:hypothetical protein